jgi:hypothetical protein
VHDHRFFRPRNRGSSQVPGAREYTSSVVLPRLRRCSCRWARRPSWLKRRRSTPLFATREQGRTLPPCRAVSHLVSNRRSTVQPLLLRAIQRERTLDPVAVRRTDTSRRLHSRQQARGAGRARTNRCVAGYHSPAKSERSVVAGVQIEFKSEREPSAPCCDWSCAARPARVVRTTFSMAPITRWRTRRPGDPRAGQHRGGLWPPPWLR